MSKELDQFAENVEYEVITSCLVPERAQTLHNASYRAISYENELAEQRYKIGLSYFREITKQMFSHKKIEFSGFGAYLLELQKRAETL